MTRASQPKPLSVVTRVTILAACLRPHLLLPATLAAATGFVLRPGFDRTPERLSGPGPAALLIGWSLVLGAVHVVNLAADRDTDRLNRKNLFWMDRLAVRHLAWTAVLLAMAGLGAAAWSGPAHLLPVGATLLLGLAYSLRPLQLSRRWGWDALANVAGYALLAPWIGSAAGSPPADPVRFGLGEVPAAAVLYLAPLVFAAFLLTTVLDASGDERVGKITWSVRFSPRATGVLAAVVLAVSWLASRWCTEVGAGRVLELSNGKAALVAAAAPAILGAAALAALAAWAPRGRRRFLVAAVFTTVLAAGGPALIAFPRLGFPLAGWLAGSYLLLFGATRVSNRARRSAPAAAR